MPDRWMSAAHRNNLYTACRSKSSYIVNVMIKGNSHVRRFTEVVGKIFAHFGLTPNQWTFISLIVVIIATWFIIAREFVTAAIIIVISLFIDVIDGAVARHTGQTTKSGGFLDTIIDRYVEGLIIFGLVWIELPGFIVDARIWLFVYFFGSFMTTYVKASAKEKELIDKELIGGFLGRAERMILLVIGFLLAPINPQYLVYIIAVLAILSNLSVFHRIWLAVNQSRSLSRSKLP